MDTSTPTAPLMVQTKYPNGSGTWVPVEWLADELADIIDDDSPGWITYMTHPQFAVVSVRQ